MKLSIAKRNLAITIPFVLISTLSAYAAPSITSTSGSFTHRQTVTVNGTGFGTKSPVSPLLYDPVDGMYANITNGGVVPTGGSNPWAGNGNGNPPSFKTTNPRGKNVTHYSNSGSLSGNGAAIVGENNYPVVGNGKFYVSWWMWASSSGDVDNSSNKFYRLTPDAHWNTAVVQWTPSIQQIYDFSSGYRLVDYTSAQPSRNTWSRMESIVDNGATPYHPRLSYSINNKVVFNKASGDAGTNGAGATAGSVANITGIYMIGADYTANNGTGLNAATDFGEIYVDNTLARVEICNANTKSGSDHCEIQVPTTTWSDNGNTAQLQINVNQGSFADNSTAYLYVIDASGTASTTNSVSTITFGSSGSSGDSTNPAVSISSPASNATVSGNVTVTASASDNVSVSKVAFYLDSTSSTAIATATSSPYTFTWNTATVANGTHTIYAKATDSSNNSTTSAGIAVTISNTSADTTYPTVSVTAPASNTTVSGNVAVTASASDNAAVSKVEFYLDSANSTAVSTVTASPYTFTWNTAAAANGSHTLYAKATDTSNNATISAGIPVTVSNTASAGTYTVTFGNATGADYPNTLQDTYIDINTNVNATSTLLSTYTWPQNTPCNAILMQWNLSALPANAQIQSATLQLYMNYMEAGGGDSSYTIPVSKIINKSPVIAKTNGYTYDGTTPWDPSSIPYNSIPLAQANISPAVDTQQIDKTYGYKSWNVTSIVKGWLATPANNYGLLLNGSSTNGADSNRGFASSRASDPTQRPKLVVTYTTGLTPVKNLGVTVITE